jgi:hypothetical protein
MFALFFSSPGLKPMYGDHVERARQEVDTAFSSGCTPLFLKAEPQSTGRSWTGSACPCGSARRVFDVGLLAFEVGFHRGRRPCSTAFSISFRATLRPVLEARRGSADGPTRAQVFALPDPFFHGDQVDDALELVLGTDRKWTGTGVAPVRSLIISTQLKKSAPILSILLTKTMRGTLYGRPDATRFRSAARHRRWRRARDGAVEHAQRTLDLDGEVDVAGGVDDVEAACVSACRSSAVPRRWWSQPT